MVLHLVCDCGNDVSVSEQSSGAQVLCPRCGRRLNHPTGGVESLPSQKMQAVEETGVMPPSTADDYPTTDGHDNEATQFTMPNAQPASPPDAPPPDDTEEDTSTRLYDSHFSIGDEPDSAGLGKDEETVVASQSGSPSKTGSSHERSGELDLSERVMSTISRPTMPLGNAVDTGLYGIHRIMRTHQKGGMGRILIAYDQFLKRDVALKELHPEVADDMSIVRRFIGEAEITAQLEHPGIVPIHALSLDEDGHPYYTMKLIKGHTLQEAIKAYHRNPSRSELFHLVRRLVSICKTMTFAHKKGVIHRDLKPANIMLGEHGETLIMDWGLAKPFSLDREDSSFTEVAIQHQAEPRPELTMVGAIVGTPAFMSPEQASPEDYVVGPLSDIFSLGTILYYLLAGQTAFSGRSTHEVLNKVRAASPPRPSEIKPNVSKGLEAICLKAMAKNPEDRYLTAAAMDDDLCRWLDGEPVLAQTETTFQRIRRWIDKYRLLSISIPLVVIAMLILINFGIYLDRVARENRMEKKIQAVMTQPVDLTGEPSVSFGASFGIEIQRKTLKNAREVLKCHIVGVPETAHGFIEMAAPSQYAWDLRERDFFVFSLLEESQPDRSEGLENFFVRMGRGSSYFEYRPGEWWKDRQRDKRITYAIPLAPQSGLGQKNGRPWTRTETTPAVPSMARIEWVEIHFDISERLSFQIDRISFRKEEEQP